MFIKNLADAICSSRTAKRLHSFEATSAVLTMFIASKPASKDRALELIEAVLALLHAERAHARTAND